MRARRPGPETALSALLAVAFAAAHAVHIGLDRAWPSYDEAWYLEVALRLFDAFRDGPSEFARAYAAAFLIKAPLLSVLPLPFFPLLGRTLDAALAPNVLGSLALSAYLHMLARRLYGRRAGPFAVAAANTFPLLFGLTRLLYAESLLAAASTAWVFHLFASRGLRRRGHLLALGAILGAGLLLKVLFPFLVLPPTAAALYFGSRPRRLSPGAAEAAAKTVLGIGLAIALTWYAFNWMTVLGFAFQAGFGSIAAPYHAPAPFLPAVLRYWKTIALQALSPYYAVAIVAAALACLRRPIPAGRVLAAWLGLPLLVFSLARAREVRFLAPLLPPAALLLAGAWSRLAPRRMDALALLFFALPAWTYFSLSFGAAERLSYAGPPRAAADWGQEKILDLLAARGVRSAAIAVEHEAFNANLFAALAAARRLPLRFFNIGHAQDSEFKAAIRLRDKDADAVVLARGLPAAELSPAFNRANEGLRRLLEAGALPFAPADVLDLGRGASASLYLRREN